MAEPDPMRLTRRRWYAIAGAWGVLLLAPLAAALGSAAPPAVRGLEALAVLAYAGCWVFGLFEAFTRRLPLLSAGLLVVMAGLFVVTTPLSGSLGTSFLVVAVIVLIRQPWGTVAAVVVGAGAVGVLWWQSGNHLSSAIGKTTASTRAEAVRLADEHGWL